jgi:hypothetical protein
LFVITVDVGAAFFFVDSELGAVASGIEQFCSLLSSRIHSYMLKLSPQFILFPAVPMS